MRLATSRTLVAGLLRGMAALCIMALAVCLAGIGEARADLKLCNRMSYVVEAAIGLTYAVSKEFCREQPIR